MMAGNRLGLILIPLILLFSFSVQAAVFNAQQLFKPLETWRKNLETQTKNAREMPGVVYISGGIIEKLDCKNKTMEVKPTIGNTFYVTMTFIEDVRTDNHPGYCQTVPWLTQGARVDIAGRYKWINKKNMVYKAKILPHKS